MVLRPLLVEQLPLGLFPGGSYASNRVIYSPRDLFLMLTDGITEVANARAEEFSLARLQDLLTQHATKALPEIWDVIMREVRQHGRQQDDQGLLPPRPRPTHPSHALIPKGPRKPGRSKPVPRKPERRKKRAKARNSRGRWRTS